MYARGILIGTMVYEVSDQCSVSCDKNDMLAEIEFKSKVFFSLLAPPWWRRILRTGSENKKIKNKK